MAFTALILVLTTFMTMGFSLPLSTGDTTPVNCFTMEGWTAADHLISAAYDFCTNNFPTDRITEQTSLSRGFDLPFAGQQAIISVDLDPVVGDWSPSSCLYLLSNIVSECKSLDDVTPGGEYSPIGSGASRFKISIVTPGSKSARSLPDPAAYHFDPTEDTSSKVQGSCDGTPTEPNATNIASDIATSAVEDFCTANDNVILRGGDERSMLVDSVTPNMVLYTKATRSVKLTKDWCLGAMTSLIGTCTNMDSFYGGSYPDTQVAWSITLRNPAMNVKSIAEDSGDAKKVSRSMEGTTPELFNATESTNGLFTTKCNAGPWIDGARNIDYDTAYRAIDYKCFFLIPGIPLAKDEQLPLTFTDTNPNLFANTIASETVTPNANDCKWAYDTLFKACVWDGRFYGGSVEVGPVRWVLDLLPAGDANQATGSIFRNIESGSEVAIPDYVPVPSTIPGSFNSTGDTNQFAENVCFNVPGHTTKYLFAMVAAWNLCVQTDNADWDKGEVKTWTLQEEVIGQMVDPPVKVTMEATLSTGMNQDHCYEQFGYYVIVPCTVQDICFGGTHEWLGMKYTVEILDPIGDDVQTLDVKINGTTQYPTYAISPAADTSASTLKQRQADNCIDNGVAVNRDRAYTDARDMCLRIGTVNWSAGDGLTHLYQYGTNWISARVVAFQDTSLGFQNCWAAFDALMNVCNANNMFTGGYLDRDGAKWSLQAVAPQSQAIDAGTGEAVARIQLREPGRNNTSSDGPVVQSSNDDPPQQSGCIRAESTPISKDSAAKAIQQFCPKYDGSTIAAGQSISDTIGSGANRISMRVTAMGADYMLYPQNCYGSFMSLLSACSDGFEDDYTPGGTLMGGPAAFTLTMALV